jgi:phosphate transport system permease protein
MRDIKQRIKISKFWNGIFWIMGLMSTLIGLVLLLVLMIDLFTDGAPRLSYKFFTSFPSRFPEDPDLQTQRDRPENGSGNP